MNTPALGADARRIHRELLRYYVDYGSIPTAQELADAAQIPMISIPDHCRELSQAGYVHFDYVGQPTCLYTFSISPTPHVLGIDGQPRFAMCAVVALGVANMLGQPVSIECRCATCGNPVHLMVQPEGIKSIIPATGRLVIGRLTDGSWNTAPLGNRSTVTPKCWPRGTTPFKKKGPFLFWSRW